MSRNVAILPNEEACAVKHDVSVTSMDLHGILVGGQGPAFAADNLLQ